MTNTDFVELQTIRLAQAAPLDKGTWTSCRKGRFGICAAERVWAELRGDVILLYPACEIERQLHMHLSLRRPNAQIKSNLQELLEKKQQAMSPTAYASFVLGFSSRVPKSNIVPVLFRICKTQIRTETRVMTFTAYRQSAGFPRKTLSLVFDSTEAMEPWKDAVESVPELYEKTLSDFSLVRHVGRGGTGNVFLVRDRFSHKKIAMKAIEKGSFSYQDSIRRLVDERIVYSMMRKHPYILEMSHAYETPERMYVATEYCSRGDLFSHIGHYGGVLPEETAKMVAAQILLALETLHDQGIWYRDLKPENVMVADSGHVKLGDFGTAKIINRMGSRIPRANSTVGTAEYLAPEVVLEKPYNRTVDLWAFGIFLCEILNGQTPFQGDTPNATFQNIEWDPLVLPTTMPESAKSLISALLKRDPTERLGSGCNGWRDVKNHPWFDTIDWDVLLHRPELAGPFPPIGNEAAEEGSTDFDDGTAAGQRKRIAVQQFADDLKRDYHHVTCIRYKHETNVDVRVPRRPLSSKRSVNCVFGSYSWRERTKSKSLLSLEPQAPLSIPDVKNGNLAYAAWSPNGAQWQPSTEPPKFGIPEFQSFEALRAGFWTKVSSAFKGSLKLFGMS